MEDKHVAECRQFWGPRHHCQPAAPVRVIMVAPSGTYAAIVFPIALSKAAVRALLPQWLIDGTGGQPLLPIPREQLAALGTASSESDETHLLVVQLGWQAGTGIGPRALGLHFHEFKVDVPYVRHPRWASGRASGTQQPAFSYKLSIGFDSRLLHLAGFVAPGPGRCVYAGAGVLEGMRRALHLSRPPRVTSVPTDGHLRSKELGVHPHTSPSLAAYPPRAPTLAYTAPACVSVAFTARPTTDDAGWDAMRTLLALPWYGGWTGNNVVEVRALRFTRGA